MAYFSETGIRHCAVCNRAATGTVFNRLNAPVGEFCKRHGEQRAREISQREEEAYKLAEETK